MCVYNVLALIIYYTPETQDVHTLIWWAMIILMILHLMNYSSSGLALVYIYIYIPLDALPDWGTAKQQMVSTVDV